MASRPSPGMLKIVSTTKVVLRRPPKMTPVCVKSGTSVLLKACRQVTTRSVLPLSRTGRTGGGGESRKPPPVEAPPTRDRQPPELDAQDIDQKGGERESRDRDAGHQEQDDGGVRPAVAVDCGAASGEGTERESDRERRQ